MTNGTERFAADLAKVCRRARAELRAAARAVFCPLQAAASSMPPYRLFAMQAAASSMPPYRLFIKLAPLALLAALLGGCSREQPQQQPQPLLPPEEAVVTRMEDSAYRSQLESLRAAQSEIAERASAINKELEAARAEDPESAKTKELEKKHAAVLKEMEAQRAKALVAIRNRMLQAEADAKAGNKKENK